jgi:mannose-6-phosphate isomerase-like protein (cupin superfamily)
MIGPNQIEFKLTEAQTWGQMGSAEMVIAPKHLGTPPHFHKHFDEVVRVLEGTVTVLVGETTYEVPAGGWHLRPRGIIHSFWNAGTTPARTIEIYLPSGHEDYMRQLAALFENGKQPTPDELTALGERNDVHFDFSKLPGIISKYGVTL